MFKTWFCDHDYEIKDKEVRKPISAKEVMTFGWAPIDGFTAGKVVWLLKCSKCDHVKILAEKI